MLSCYNNFWFPGIFCTEIIMKGVLHVICQLLIFIREELVRISILEVLNNIFTVRDKVNIQ